MLRPTRMVAVLAACAAAVLGQAALASHVPAGAANSPAARLSGKPDLGLKLGVNGGRVAVSPSSRPHTFRATPHTYRGAPHMYRAAPHVFRHHHRPGLVHRHHGVHRHHHHHHHRHHIHEHHGHRRPAVHSSRCSVRGRR